MTCWYFGYGSNYDYGFRIYNPGIARFLSVDPIASDYPWYTPYQFAGNMPIKFIDLDGLEPADPSDPTNTDNTVYDGGDLEGPTVTESKSSGMAQDNTAVHITNTRILHEIRSQTPDKFWKHRHKQSGVVVGYSTTDEIFQYAYYRNRELANSILTEKYGLDPAIGMMKYSVKEAISNGYALISPIVLSVVPAGGIFLRARLPIYAKYGATLRKGQYQGVRAASKYLRESGVPRVYRKQILESFEISTISLNKAGSNTFGLRFYGGNANSLGRYLFPTFTNYTNRVGLALPSKWNAMSSFKQFQIAPGTPYIFGRAASQGGRYTGGGLQIYVNDLTQLR